MNANTLPRTGRASSPPRRRGSGAGLGLLLLLVSAWTAPAQVELSLRIPPAETYVLGDPIPLGWSFRNQGSRALGFMWEGCCRLNGKLEVSATGKSLDTVPSGQALAHMFAKAEKLEPGVTREYDTKVSDWVLLPGTGEFELRGRYRGVLPTQVPQIPRGLDLWRDAAESGVIRLTVLSPRDYLAQREVREQRRGMRVRCVVPGRLRALGSQELRVQVENLRDQPRRLRWPEDLNLWFLDAQGHRALPSLVLNGPSEVLELPPRGAVERVAMLAPERFEGEPLGAYQAFVELHEAGPEAPRVPSLPQPIRWELDDAEVQGLLAAAARGGGTGARNAQLKFLRVYLAEVGPALERASAATQALPAEARALAGRLAVAARLKPISPRPGLVELSLDIPASGAPAWTDARIPAALASFGPDWAQQLGTVLAARRHLGWEVGVVLRPDPEAPVGRTVEFVERLDSWRDELASVPVVLLRTEAADTNAWARLYPALAPASAASSAAAALPILRVSQGGATWATNGVDFVEVGTPAARSAAVERANRLGFSRGWVRLETSLTWREVLGSLEPFGRLGLRWEWVPAAWP